MKSDQVIPERQDDREPSDGPTAAFERLLDQHDLILFDGVCALCSAFVRFVMRHERGPSFTFVSMQSPLGQRVLGHFELPPTGWDSFILVEAGTPFFKSSGMARIAAALRAPWSWLRWIRVVPRPVRDWGYDRVARNRYSLFGRYDSCMIPDPTVAGRFLDSL